MLRALLGPVLERVRDVPVRAALVAKLARETGLLWNLSTDGALEAVRALISSGQNPSLIYRLQAKNMPDKAALVQRDVSWTFRELDDRIDRIANGLRARGIGRGKSVLVMLRNRPEIVLTSAACARLGASAVAVSWRSRPDELAYLVNHSGSLAIVTEVDLVSVVEEAAATFERPAVKRAVFSVGGRAGISIPYDDLYGPSGRVKAERGAEDDAAVVVYTSGTTGKPKGAVRKFPKDTLAAATRFLLETPLRTDDVHLVACPMYHSTAYGFLTLTHVTGATCVLLEEWKPETFLAAIERHVVTTTAVVPTMLHRVLSLPEAERKKYDARSLRAVFAGGAPLSGTLSTAFMDVFGDVLYQFYGATETGLVTLAKPHHMRHAPGTIGPALPGNDVKLLDDDGNEVGKGAVGELYVKNDLLVSGYHDDAAATEKSKRSGYFSVGDLARRDHDGNYFIEGRKRDMVISGGVNVYPVEIESVIESHPDVAEAAVVGVPDEEWGERVRAFVVKRDGAVVEEASLKGWLKERLAGPKVPRDVVFIDTLPRNPTGKVLKRELVSR